MRVTCRQNEGSLHLRVKINSPEERKAEDGPTPDRYLLQKLPGADYLQRTRRNVVDSDGTLVIAFGEPAGGTLATVRFCERLRKPVLVVDALRTNAEDIAVQLAEFVLARSIKVLSVAGPLPLVL
jgi:hypothetical protein